MLHKTYPLLKGNFVDQDILNSKEFFDVFKDAFMDVDDFSGVLTINLLKDKGKSQGQGEV